MQTCHIQLQMGYSLWQDRMNTSVLSEVFSSLAPLRCSTERERVQPETIPRLERD